MTSELKTGDPKVMKDGTTAYLTRSANWYCRREPFPDFKRIVYYTLEGDHIPLAKGRCSFCHQILESQTCGDFVQCECKRSFVDTDRWNPERRRYGGDIINLNLKKS